MSVEAHWLYNMSDFQRGQLFIGNVKQITCPWCNGSWFVQKACHDAKDGEYVLLQRLPCICNPLRDLEIQIKTRDCAVMTNVQVDDLRCSLYLLG